jgi:uncharacterized membrane protein YagU involved in acid resistance
MSIGKIEGKHIKAGIISGIIGGVGFGAVMGLIGMLPTLLPMIAKLFGGSSPILGLIVHVVFSAIIGFIFSIFLGHLAVDRARGVVLGLVYGLVWWFLGPLIIMPVWLGMGVQLSAQGMKMALPSLWGHLVYGFILGLVYPVLTKSKEEKACPKCGHKHKPDGSCDCGCK